MTTKERVIYAINHQETDYVPYTVEMCREAFDKMVEFYKDPGFMNKVQEHIVLTGASGFPREKQISGNIYQDEFGTRWDKTMDKGVGVIVAPIFTEDTFDEYEFPEPSDTELYSHIREFTEKNKDRFTIACIGLA
ncbi:MAG: hypothetical protein Q7J78_04420, partial [Clostridiales bacterium]|nr:hypothetical protein [Clostridiales bacterium]